jgi:L-cystine uptake protein TcyP (sodium:dicarboxylate symporter family)
MSLMSLKGESHYAMSRLFFRGLVAVVTVGLMGNALVPGTATVEATVQDAMEMQCHPC